MTAEALPVGERTEALRAILEAYPGAQAVPVPVPHGRPPPAVMYKVMAKIFAILNTRGGEAVLLKCDPDWSDLLREQYRGIGHRSHLDPRHWIDVKLDADVPPEEVERLIARSYELVCAGLTRKQRAELAALGVRAAVRTAAGARRARRRRGPGLGR